MSDFAFKSNLRRYTVALTISAPPVQLDLRVGFSGGSGCDAVNGDFLYGSITIKLTEDNQLSGSVRGAKHCDSHPQVMHALGATPPRISPKYDAIAKFLDANWEQRQTQIALEGMFPMYNIHGRALQEADIRPCLKRLRFQRLKLYYAD